MTEGEQYFENAQKLYHNRQFEQAAELFRKAPRLKQERNWWHHAGECYGRLADWVEMEKCFYQAVQLGKLESNPVQLAWFYFGLGRSKKLQKKFVEAIHDFNEAINIGHDDFLYGSGAAYGVFLLLAESYKAIGNYQYAIYSYHSYSHYSGHPHVSGRAEERLKGKIIGKEDK